MDAFLVSAEVTHLDVFV